MADRSTVVVFDVNETLSDMTPMAQRFAEVGAPPQLARAWFASLLRDGFALAAAGTSEKFATLGEGVLRMTLAGERLNRQLDEAIEHITAGFRSLPVHPDVPGGVRKLRRAGLRLVTLGNGSTGVAEALLARAGLREEFEQLLSVEDAGIWKPARAAYQYAATACGVRPEQMMLVAAHPWDVDGASRAGMATAWINRAGSSYPRYFTAPGRTARSVADLADQLSS
jgi:2-haloacid dehalogenase